MIRDSNPAPAIADPNPSACSVFSGLTGTSQTGTSQTGTSQTGTSKDTGQTDTGRKDVLPAEKPRRDQHATIEAGPIPQPEQERQGELGRIQSKVALWDSDERQARAHQSLVLDAQPFKPSDRVHVMGLDLTGRYIAHTLAGCETIPPVRYMLHRHYLLRQWKESEKQLTLYCGDRRITRRRVVAEYISEEQAEGKSGSVVDNLIVTLPASQVVQALGHIRHRLDHRSTICLVNDGLGVVEALIEAYFPDLSTRPTFILGHFTTKLGHTDSRFSVAEVRPGRLFLSVFSPHEPGGGERFYVKRHPPLERTVRATHLIRLLTAMPGLNATGHPMTDFLRFKLPTVAFRTIVDPLAALLNCRYDHLPTNPYARHLMDRLIGELSHVLSLFPECRQSRRFRRFAATSSLREAVYKKLTLQRTADSKMRAQFAHGWDTDVDFLSGYFVRRGREVQASVATLEAVGAAAKARQVIFLKQVEGDIPFGTTESPQGDH
ncbi:ketopantoate reductase PanE/ApbA-domain-containing protein [Parachaetomium inaequale]|uniref:Ketopantoate reductase PanE/ApbA-domain-containing protein n=1 Tax=Parachaetomium inaequale TaxID=2588326 RepID=A0AAN6PLM5_9PEZI|nr:ketopantoate reductase PanE/ApbA-domain-containing protein [Parachaetomium inaequale]